MDDDSEKLVDSFLQHEQMKETAAYLQRGRAHAALSTDQLQERWSHAFRSWFATREGVQAMEDLGAELHLRGLEPPYDRVSAEVDAARQELMRDGFKSSPSVRGKLAAFLEERDKLN